MLVFSGSEQKKIKTGKRKNADKLIQKLEYDKKRIVGKGDLYFFVVVFLNI